MEGSLAGLEVAQSEGLSRVSSDVTVSLAEAETTLQATFRSELQRNMEPFRHLPAMLLAAVRPVLPEPGLGAWGRGPDEGGVGVDPRAAEATSQQLQLVLAAELDAAVNRLMDSQVGRGG